MNEARERNARVRKDVVQQEWRAAHLARELTRRTGPLRREPTGGRKNNVSPGGRDYAPKRVDYRLRNLPGPLCRA
jgi:hypothetical protein